MRSAPSRGGSNARVEPSRGGPAGTAPPGGVYLYRRRRTRARIPWRTPGYVVNDLTPFTPTTRRGAGGALSVEVKTPRKRSTRRRSRGAREPQLTSVSTSRTAYAETKRWLIEQHGPVCAYCGGRVAATKVTLDHVTPRRGQTAYDRRDNLVLACEDCNGAKADMPILAFLLRKRERAAVLLRYGAHLSPMLVDLVRGLVPAGGELPRVKERFDDLIAGDESPYHDSPYRD